MLRAFRFSLLLLLILSPLSLYATTVTVGNVATPNAIDGNIATVRTSIDLVHPATATGSLTSGTVYWSPASCANALKFKFFRRVGDTLTLTAERGPYTPTSNQFTVTFSPAVSVQQGDLIGVARVANCGNPGAVFGFPSEGFLQYASDVTGSVEMSAATAHPGGVLAVSATGTASESMARVIPVVGSLTGGFGSQFKTEMQFFNPQTNGSMVAKLVFHPMLTAGSTADTTRLVSLDPGEVFSTADVVAAMGQSGLGSLDISVPAGQAVPIMLTRVYNDEGVNGTSSLTEEAISTSEVIGPGMNLLARGVTGFLVAPRDMVQTRFNIGIRTLYSGATITFTQRNAHGEVVRTVTRTYTANYLIHTDAAVILGGPVAADDSIQVSVGSGSAIVYGTTTDNDTNDPAIQFVYGVYAIA